MQLTSEKSDSAVTFNHAESDSVLYLTLRRFYLTQPSKTFKILIRISLLFFIFCTAQSLDRIGLVLQIFLFNAKKNTYFDKTNLLLHNQSTAGGRRVLTVIWSFRLPAGAPGLHPIHLSSTRDHQLRHCIETPSAHVDLVHLPHR